jgi:N-acetyl-anhydromuramyl-L-alanine amidase AmpD
MRRIDHIVVHTTYTSQKATLEDLKKGWKSLGWKNNGYHYIIHSNGDIENITPEENIANGVAGFNSNSIHVAYIGGRVNNRPKDNRTELQKAALIVILTELKIKYPKARILGHRDFSPDTNKNGKIDTWEFIKECPCFNAITEYQNI